MIDPNKPPPPKQLSLTASFRPQGYYTVFKQWPIYPNSSNQYWMPNDVVRFYNTVDSGVMDPYRSSIQFTVTTNQAIQPVGGLQVDKMASSFFGQMVISSRNTQIQRIGQYDTLCAMLSDIGTSQIITQGRTFQGLGYSQHQTQSNWNCSKSTSSQVICNFGGNSSQNWLLDTPVQNTVLPTRVGSYTGRGNQTTLSSAISQVGSPITPYTISGNSNTNVGLHNYLWCGPGQSPTNSGTDQQVLQNILTNQGRFNNIRAQYQTLLTINNYPDTNTSTLQTNPSVLNQQWSVNSMLGNSLNSGFNPKSPYVLSVPQTQISTMYNPQIQNNIQLALPNNAQSFGYLKSICPQTMKGGNQSILSATIPQCQMNAGQITNNKFPVTQRKFCVPLFSAVCGALIPPDQFLLIQMKALKDLLIQLTLSPYGMFTTGYCDVHQFDQYGMGIQQKRAWSISSICWNIHLYNFTDSNINQALNSSLVKGIAITSSFYFLGNTFQLPSGQVVRNMWPISCQSQSLSQIYCLFLSNQYQKYSFCRKQFRLSNNITSMQVRLKTQFFPTQPIIGNAGNPQYFNNQMDNSNFLRQLFFSNNYLFNLNVPMPKINKVNFAINGRCYNTSNTNTFYNSQMFLNPMYNWSNPQVNLDTALGMPYYQQNRYIGMALYCWTWDPYGHSTEYMNGINTNGNQNFAVQFTTASTNYFPSDQTLIIFCRSNGIVIYSQQGVKVIGK